MSFDIDLYECAFCQDGHSYYGGEGLQQAAEERSIGMPAFNASAVDFSFASIRETFFGHDTYWQSISLVFTFQLLRSLGTALSGYVYYFLLSATGGDEELEQLDFAFSEQTVSNHFAVNFLVWSLFVLGRTVYTLAAYGSLPSPPSADTIVRGIAHPTRIRVFMVRFFFEWVGMFVGFLLLGAAGHAIYGDVSVRKRRKRVAEEVEGDADVEGRMERNYLRILKSVEKI